MVEVSSMEGNNLHKSCESTGPLLVKQSIILALYERSRALSHCQRPDKKRRVNTMDQSSKKRNQLTLEI